MTELEAKIVRLRLTIEGVMASDGRLTAQSRRYRRRASELAAKSYETLDSTEQLNLLDQALQWVRAAENEEILAAEDEK